MQTQLERMEWFFNITFEEMNKELTKSKMALDNMRGERHTRESHEPTEQNISKVS